MGFEFPSGVPGFYGQSPELPSTEMSDSVSGQFVFRDDDLIAFETGKQDSNDAATTQEGRNADEERAGSGSSDEEFRELSTD